jgi:hypothetical protein
MPKQTRGSVYIIPGLSGLDMLPVLTFRLVYAILEQCFLNLYIPDYPG